MQPISPVTPSELLYPVQELLYRHEVWDGAAWVDLCDLEGVNYLKKMSVKLGGAGVSPDPVAGKWSAEISNDDSLFHPFHPSSPYAGLLRAGRPVRISVGGMYSGVARYWQRLIGFMDAPNFDQDNKTVSLKGTDYMKRLTDTVIRPSEVDVSGNVNGPSHWGKRATFDSKASFTETGSQLYNYGDALDPEAETLSIDATWETSDHNSVFEPVDEGGAAPYYGRYLEADGGSGWVRNTAIASLTVDARYIFRVRYRAPLGGDFTFELAQTVDGSRRVISSWAAQSTPGFVTEVVNFKAAGTGLLELKIIGSGLGISSMEIDWVSVRAGLTNWNDYQMPPDSNGPFYVTLDGQEVSYGDPVAKDGTGGGYYYDEGTKNFYFDEDKTVEAGTDNLHIYYYTTHNLDDVLADLLVTAHYFENRSEALAAMDYSPTGLEIPRVWFDVGSTALSAVKLICERCSYRFWFAFDGTPVFKPAPVIGTPVFLFTAPGHVRDPGVFQDRTEVRNRIVIEGTERGMFATREEKIRGRISGEASDQASIDEHLEKTHQLTSHLFQDQDSIDDMCGILLAKFKDPKWYSEPEATFNPVPLEIGDTIGWPVELKAAPAGEEGAILVEVLGLIRDIEINDGLITYTCELALSGGEMEAHALLSSTHPDTEKAAPQEGDMILAEGAGAAPEAAGSPEHELLSEMHDDTEAAAPESADVIVASGDPVLWKRLPAGSPGQIFEMSGTLPGWGRRITSSDSPPDPEEGSDGDIWLEY